MKTFHQGDIVYIVEQGYAPFSQYSILPGIVESQYDNGVIVHHLVIKNTETIDGIPIQEYRNQKDYGKFKKLPKNWSYNSNLFESGHTEIPGMNEWFSTTISDIASVKTGYEKGYLVPDCIENNLVATTDIQKEGFRILIREYRTIFNRPYTYLVQPENIFTTFQQAKEFEEFLNREKLFTAQLSDEDYFDYEVKNITTPYLKRYGCTGVLLEQAVSIILDFFRSLSSYPEIEVRSLSTIEWKYSKQKIWKPLPDTILSRLGITTP